MSKIIGIPGWAIDNKYFGVTLPYAEFIKGLGTLRILNNTEDIQDLDLLVLPGGLDVNPSRHGKDNAPSFYTGSSNAQLEYFDTHILPQYVENGTPILGICRGAQSLFTMFGGTMDQHNFLHTQSNHPKDECHPLDLSEAFYELFPESIEIALESKHNITVNSRHHQTMLDDNLPEDIIPIAKGLDVFGKHVGKTNFLEIFKINNRPIIGMQYHPEDCINSAEFNNSIIQTLIRK